jgi:hypothetical protein
MAKAPRKLNVDQLKHLARAGAEATLHRLRHEIDILERTFPELATPRGRKQVTAAVQRRAGRMSRKARQAVSDRMKKYWAERKKSEAKGR